MNAATTQSTLDLLKTSLGTPDANLAKAFTQSGSATSGLTAYPLEAGAKSLFPVITPLRNATPRVSGAGGIQAAWRAVIAINANSISAGLGQGNRGAVIATTTKDYTAAYKGIGHEDYVTYEAEDAGQGFDDVRALATRNALSALMISEEKCILGGNSSLQLATTPTPTTSTATTGGTIAASGGGGYNVYCVALSYEGYLTSSVSLAGVPGQVSRTNADGSVETYGGGSANKSAAGNQVTTGSTSTVTASVAVVRGAYGYAWYIGLAGSELLAAITTINSVTITALPSGTQNASAITADYSTNALIFDGLMTFAATANSGSYYYQMPTGTAGTGTPLTSDGVGGIVEIDTALKDRWDNYRLSFDEIWVNSQEQKNISTKVLAGNANTAQRFTFNVDQGVLAGGTMVKSYLNKYSMAGAQEIPIKLHPNLPAGVILFITRTLPYPMSNVPNVMQIRTRREYYQIDWPLRSRKYEFGVYADEVLQLYFPPAIGVICNIANG